MVIGNGLMAQSFAEFKAREDYLIFASGVSDSRCTDTHEFLREKRLLESEISKYPLANLVYFSSCDIANPKKNQMAYYKHKADMEEYIRQNCPKFHLLRLPQVVGKGGNPRTLMNFLSEKIKNGESFGVFKDAPKNILDIDDIISLSKWLINQSQYQNKTTNLLNSNYFQVIDIVNEFENHYQKSANFNWVEISERHQYNHDIPLEIIEKLHLNFSKDYIKNLIKKYYS